VRCGILISKKHPPGFEKKNLVLNRKCRF